MAEETKGDETVQVEEEETGDDGKDVSVVSIILKLIKELGIGADITKTSLPSVTCTPDTVLQKVGRDRLRGRENFKRLVKAKDPVVRMMIVIRWFLSMLSKQPYLKKPMNPALGETYACRSGETVYISEQVSHHPPISAFHFEDKHYDVSLHGHIRVEVKLGTNTVGARFVGSASLDVRKFNEHYDFEPDPIPTVHARGLLMGKRNTEMCGDITIFCGETGLEGFISFEQGGTFSSEAHKLKGHVKREGEKKPLVTFKGSWIEDVAYECKDDELNEKIKKNRLFAEGKMYSFSEIKPVEYEVVVVDEKRNSDAIWGPLFQHIRKRDWNAADAAKKEIEQGQREWRAANEYKPVWFEKDEEGETWHVLKIPE